VSPENLLRQTNVFPDDEPTPAHPPDGEFRFIHRAIRGSRHATMVAEERLTGLAGVIKANANAHTGEVYVVFEPSILTVGRILGCLDGLFDNATLDEKDHVRKSL
jgi:hypothetical protein